MPAPTVERGLVRSLPGGFELVGVDGKTRVASDLEPTEKWLPTALDLLVRLSLDRSQLDLEGAVGLALELRTSTRALVRVLKRPPYQPARIRCSAADKAALARQVARHLGDVGGQQIDAVRLSAFTIQFAGILAKMENGGRQLARLATELVRLNSRNGEWMELALAAYLARAGRPPGRGPEGSAVLRWLADRHAMHLVWGFGRGWTADNIRRVAGRWGPLGVTSLYALAWVALMLTSLDFGTCRWAALLAMPAVVILLGTLVAQLSRRPVYVDHQIVGSSLVGLLFLAPVDEVREYLFAVPPWLLVLCAGAMTLSAGWFWLQQIRKSTDGIVAGDHSIRQRAIRVLAIHLLVSFCLCLAMQLVLAYRPITTAPISKPVLAVLGRMRCLLDSGPAGVPVAIYLAVPLSAMVTLTGIIVQLWWQSDRR